MTTMSVLFCVGAALLLVVAAIVSIVAYEREMDEMIAALDGAEEDDND